MFSYYLFDIFIFDLHIDINIHIFLLTGHFCPSGTTSTRPCPAGTFNPSTGLGHQTECLGCIPGHYCGGVGLNETSGNCTVGYFCSQNATSSSPNDGVTGLCGYLFAFTNKVIGSVYFFLPVFFFFFLILNSSVILNFFLLH